MEKGIILFDTCSYIRLASYLGDDFFNCTIKNKQIEYSFQIHKFVNYEISKKSALSNKFPILPSSNKYIFKLSQKYNKILNENYSIIEYSSAIKGISPPLSPIDMKCLAYQMISSFSIISCTDDKNMIIMAKHLNLKCFSSIEIIMKLYMNKSSMLDILIDYKEYLQVFNDWPKFFDKFMKSKYKIELNTCNYET